MNFLEGGGRARGLKEKDGREGFRGAEGGLAEERAGSSEKTRITGGSTSSTGCSATIPRCPYFSW